MSVNLDKHRDSILAAWRDVLNEGTPTNWALFGYEGLSNDLKFVSKGDGGLDELVDDFNSGKIMYAFLKVDVPDSSVAKYVLINWQGEGAPTVRKGTCANHIKHISQLLNGFHLTMHARTEDDLEMKIILERLAKAGSAFNFKRTEEIAPSGPVGTAYQKVNPGKEINSKERDQFWLKEEEEEKRRQAAERTRREEERRREDEKRRDDRLSSPEAREPVAASASEVLRRQRSAEARQLIGSTSAARAVFQQHLAQGALHKSPVPEKPIRNSVIAQRINSLTQQAQSKPEPKPVITLEPELPTEKPQPPSPTQTQDSALKPERQDPPKTSPIRNIDKIAMSLESPSQIQYEPIIDPSADLSPSTETEPSSFGSYAENGVKERELEKEEQSEPMIKQNILENDMFDASYSSSSNDNDDDDSDNKFSTIKRSPYSKNNISEGLNDRELCRQDTVIENVNYKKEHNGNTTLEDISPEGMDDDGIYQDLDEDPGLTARALYDYQAADETEISFDPGDLVTHIDQIDEGWWQGLGPQGHFGLFPANYVELLPAKVK